MKVFLCQNLACLGKFKVEIYGEYTLLEIFIDIVYCDVKILVLVLFRGVAQVVERLVRDQEVAGSSPVTPITAYVAVFSYPKCCTKYAGVLFLFNNLRDNSICYL